MQYIYSLKVTRDHREIPQDPEAWPLFVGDPVVKTYQRIS